MKAKKKHNGGIRAKKSYKKGGIFPPKIQQMKNNLEPVIYDGMLDEVVVTPYTSSEYALGETMGNKATGGLKPVYPVFEVMTAGLGQLRKPFTAGAKSLQRALTSEKTLGKAVKSPLVPKFAKPSLLKKYKSRFPNADLRGAGTGNYTNLGVRELGLKADDFKRLTDYERSAISQINQSLPDDDVFNTFVQRYGDFNIDDDLANKLADYSRRNPRTKFEINLGLEDAVDNLGFKSRQSVKPSKRMQEIFDDPLLNVNNVFSSKGQNPMEIMTDPYGRYKTQLFYDSSARDLAGEFEKNLRSYGGKGFYAANVPTGKPIREALKYKDKTGRAFDYSLEKLPVADFMVNQGKMNPDAIVNLSRFRGASEMANKHNFMLSATNRPSLIISGNKGFAGLKGGNTTRERLSKIKYPIPNKAVPSYNQKMTPILKQEFNVLKPFEGTFIKIPSVLETYYNKAGKASPHTNFPEQLRIDNFFTR